MSKPRVVVGMSGGVDSSVTALLLKEQGYDVIGLFMKNWEDDDNSEYCSSRQDLLDAVSVADTIGIPIEAVNFAKEYKDRVFSAFLREYQAGRTPNPDILCNAEIKFKAFLDHAVQLGADTIATGHYAKVREVGGLFQLLKAADSGKDQSYFLHRLNQSQLSRAIFPLGELQKTEVRKIAEQHGLCNHAKKDSTGICFIGERPFRDFLSGYLPTQPGEMRTPEGRLVGHHIGLSFYTLGQRQGLGIGGIRGQKTEDRDRKGLMKQLNSDYDDKSVIPSLIPRTTKEINSKLLREEQKTEDKHEPWFVAGKNMAKNILIVVQGHDHPALLSSNLTALDAHWISGTAPILNHPYAAKTRYRQADAPCRITQLSDSHCAISFEQPQWAVTPGQSVVLYDGEICLGGAIIEAGM